MIDGMMGTANTSDAVSSTRWPCRRARRAGEISRALREVAATVKTLGDELVEADRQWTSANNEVVRLTEQLAEAEYQAALGGEALAAVDDFRLGLCDKDELFRRACGRS